MSDAYKNTQLDGDVSVGRNVAVGGSAVIQGNYKIKGNLRVDGWLDARNLRIVNKGIFRTEEKLLAEYQNPRNGWFAIVGETLPGNLYIVEDRKWVNTGIKVGASGGGGGDITDEDLQRFIDAAGLYFLSKIEDDRTVGKLSAAGLITGEDGVQFGADFAEGMTGFGGRVDKYGNAWFESISARRFLAVPELRYNRAYVSVGNEWNAAGAGVIDTVTPDGTAEEGGVSMSGEATLRLEDGEIGAIAVDDICMGIFHDFAAPGNNATADYDDGQGVFEFAGFCTVYFRVTEILDTEKNSRFRYTLRPVSDRWSHAFHPFAQMSFAAYGNFSDKSRQVSAYRTRSYERWLKGVDTWDFAAEHIAMQVGDLSNLSVFGYVMDGYSAFMNNLYVTGTLNQLEDVALRMEIDTGGDGFLGYGETMTATCHVMRGWRDVTEEVTEWNVERDTGNAGDDEAWALKDKAKNFAGTLEIAFTPAENDLGETTGNAPTIFTFTATTGEGAGKTSTLGTLSI